MTLIAGSSRIGVFKASLAEVSESTFFQSAADESDSCLVPLYSSTVCVIRRAVKGGEGTVCETGLSSFQEGK
jgi:hypothetical protein